MTQRDGTLAIGACGIALVLAQDVVPTWAGFHDWPYAAALGIVAVTAFGALRRATTGVAIALIGTLVILAAGIGSGLLGPDTQTVARTPGTVAPIPDAGAAAFFPDVTAADVGRGDERVTIRSRDGRSFDLGLGERRYVGATELALAPRLAAYVEAFDRRGDRLTITQPTDPSFLSPIVLFSQRVAIAKRVLPADNFATPAVRRQVKIFYFAKDDSAAGRMHGVAGAPSVLFAVDDDAGRLVPGGIGFVRNGGSTVLGGLRLTAAIGAYPALVVSAVPYEPALIVGAALLLAGAIAAGSERARDHIAKRSQPAQT